MLLYHILKGVVYVYSAFLGSFAHTNLIEFSFSVVARTLRYSSVGAVILIVGDIKLFGQGATERITTLNTNIDDTLNILDKVLAKNIAALVWFTVSGVLAICVLNNLVFTLYG